MHDPAARAATLDLAQTDVRALLAGAQALALKEIEATRDGPVFGEPPAAARVRALIGADDPLPVDGEPVEALLDACARVLGAGRRTNPGFFGYVQSPPAPVGAAADLLASAADQNVTAWRSAPAATEVEKVAVRWLGELVGFAPAAAGLLLAGGSAANLTALLLALRLRTDPAADRRALVAYTSSEGHFSVAKAAGVLGVELRAVPADAARRLDPERLEASIAEDRAAGRTPFCVVAAAGTTATGAIDPLDRLADLAAEQRLWLHVDGAYGAPAAAVAVLRERFAGLERADSLALDAHKWLYVPVDCGALLVRDPEATGRAFGAAAGEYVRVMDAEPAEAFAFWDHGIELSRRFRALKLWMTLRCYGARRLAAAIEEDIAMAAYLAERVRAADDMELLSGPELSICCFRHVPPGVRDLDAHNERLLGALQRDGRVYLSNAHLDGRFALRACITNFRTTCQDIERTLDVVRELA